MKRFILLVLLISLSLGVQGRSKSTRLVVASEWLHCNDTVLVFSPRHKAKVKDLPTLFLLHGWSGCYSDWSRQKDLQQLCDDSGFRIICPDGFYDSWYVDNADPEKMQWRKFFWNDLWPLLDGKYGLKSDRTFIDGLSMGGHGAMSIFLDHPELFRGAGSMSGVLDLRSSGGSKERIAEILGGKDINDEPCTCQSAVNRLERVSEACGDSSSQKLLVITCGQQDTRFFQAGKEFADRCAELGLRHITQFSPAKHRWPYWRWAVTQHLEWFRQEFSGEGIGEGDK